MSYDFCPAIYQRPSFDCGHNKMNVALQNFAITRRLQSMRIIFLDSLSSHMIYYLLKCILGH